MSAQNSNLNQAGFAFDLVTSMTQSSLNTQLKDVLNATGENNEPLVSYYKKSSNDCSGQTVEMTAEEVQSYITDNNIDIFSIPNGATSDDNEVLAQINGWDICFVGGMKATIGIPQSTPPNFMDIANAPNILTLQSSSTVDQNQTVLYNVYFKTFQITEITVSRTCSCSQYEQESQNPFQATYSVDLNIELSSQSFDDLPQYMQDSLQAILEDTSTMFSVQQLLLDLNTISPTAPPQTSLPADSDLGSVYEEFIQQYWTPLVENGDIVFASSASPDDYPVSNIIPTGFNFLVSPYIPNADDQLTTEEKADLATLNYLVMTNNDESPNPLQSFPWNWIDASDTGIAGIMSVKRDIFVDNLNEVLSPVIQSLCYGVDAYSDMSEDSYYLKLTDPTTNQTFSKVDSNQKYLTYSYYVEDDDHAGLTESILGSYHNYIKGSLEVDSNVYLIGSKIKIEISIYFYVEYDLAYTKTKGYPLAQTSTFVYQLHSVGVTPGVEGLLTIAYLENESGTVDHTQTNDPSGNYYNGDLDPSTFAKVISFGNADVGNWEQNVQQQADSLKNLMASCEDQIVNLLNGSFGFVFPGAKTYFFNNPAFSEQGDLTVEVAYQSVN